jgi:hypothetical protein
MERVAGCKRRIMIKLEDRLGQVMMGMLKIPRGCYAVRDWNGDMLIFDPRAPLWRSCRVIVHRPDDLRVRITGTLVREATSQNPRIIRIRMDGQREAAAYQDFDCALVTVARVIGVLRNRRADRVSSR